MEAIVDILIRFWYLWALVIAVGILDLFMPRIKRFLGEKSVSFFLSRLDETKYMVINNIMLQMHMLVMKMWKILFSAFAGAM